MKKNLVMTILVAGLLSAGGAFAADSHADHDCAQACANHCTQLLKAEGPGSVFKPLFPEYEIEPPLGGS